MASTKISALTESTAPAGSDTYTLVTSALANRRRYMGNNNLLPEGYMVNGSLQVSVASSNITVALKTKSGGNPSATDPVSVWINGSFRTCTAALSVTKNAGTGWFNAGSTGLATNEIDFFPYLIWNTTPATDIMDIGFARISYGRVYSDFSSTTTNALYLAHANASDPASTDDCVVVGRFAATLSASAAFNWSVPTFTNANKFNVPIAETRWLTWTPTLTGFSANPTDTIYNYRLRGRTCDLYIRQATNGTSSTTGFTISLPIAAKTLTNYQVIAVGGFIVNNGTAANGGSGSIESAATTLVLSSDQLGNTWAAANGKRISALSISYEIA